MTEAQADAHPAELRPPSQWRRSAKGNLYRRWGGLVLVVYPRRWDRLFGYCLQGAGDTRWSPGGFRTEAAAARAAGEAAGEAEGVSDEA